MLWQAEADPFRREVLRRRFPGIHVFDSLEAAACSATPPPSVDVLYAELPDSRIAKWWPQLWHIGQLCAQQWLVMELSPTVRCDDVLRDVALAGWAFRLVYVRMLIRMDGEQEMDCDIRKRGFVFASPSEGLVDGLGLAAMLAEIEVTGVKSAYPRLSLPWHEESRGLLPGWTCVCSSDACQCGLQQRLDAVNDATSPYLTHWIGELLDGRWRDGQDRGVTLADGGNNYDAGARHCARGDARNARSDEHVG